MRVAKLRLQRFRGFESVELVFDGHTVIAGEPRSGRTDIVEALRRVLDPRSTRSRVNPLDINRRLVPGDPAQSAAATGASQDIDEGSMLQWTEVEVTLLELGPELEDLLDDYLEPFDSRSGELADGSNAANSVLGLRLCYRAQYDFESDTGDHWVDSPARSDVDANSFRKVPRADREALPVLFLNAGPPLQIRAEGAFRALVGDTDAGALDQALAKLDGGIRTATEAFSSSTALSTGVQMVLDSGVGELLSLNSSDLFTFVPDDGTLATLLRVLQPAATLDDAGMLPLQSHGTTTQSVLSVAEGIAAAAAGSSDLVVIADDFGDQLDAPSAEYLAYLLRKASKQLLLTTRRPEVVRAFQPENVLRLTRSTENASNIDCRQQIKAAVSTAA
jgi:putative ATP-dependent endonuclease of the OLD family